MPLRSLGTLPSSHVIPTSSSINKTYSCPHRTQNSTTSFFVSFFTLWTSRAYHAHASSCCMHTHTQVNASCSCSYAVACIRFSVLTHPLILIWYHQCHACHAMPIFTLHWYAPCSYMHRTLHLPTVFFLYFHSFIMFIHFTPPPPPPSACTPLPLSLFLFILCALLTNRENAWESQWGDDIMKACKQRKKKELRNQSIYPRTTH